MEELVDAYNAISGTISGASTGETIGECVFGPIGGFAGHFIGGTAGHHFGSQIASKADFKLCENKIYDVNWRNSGANIINARANINEGVLIWHNHARISELKDKLNKIHNKDESYENLQSDTEDLKYKVTSLEEENEKLKNVLSTMKEKIATLEKIIIRSEA